MGGRTPGSAQAGRGHIRVTEGRCPAGEEDGALHSNTKVGFLPSEGTRAQAGRQGHEPL